MKRLQSYWFAIAGSILAMLVTPGNLIGLPIGIWALVVLSQRHVREAFGKGPAIAALHSVPPVNGGGGWKIAAVIVAAMMLLVAIPVGAILFAIALPNYLQARNRARQLQLLQISPSVPTFVVRGTVTDVATGQPIANARVDDNAYGARPNRPPQQAWTDAQGHYELRTWFEEHTLATSASGHETKLYTFIPGGFQEEQPAQVDFQLQPAESGEATASGPEAQALDQAVKRGGEAWNSGDYSKAFALLLPAALKGHPVAQHRVGVMYVMGQGVEMDAAEGTRWFRKAAEQGQGESQYSMGMRYLLGQSVAQDDKEAVRWFKLAADQGIAIAQAALALRYFKGEGVEQDFVEAYKWATLASDQIGPNNSGVPPAHVEEKLTPEQLAEAQRLAKEFVPKRTGPADP